MAYNEKVYFSKLAVRDALCRDLQKKRDAILVDSEEEIHPLSLEVKRTMAETAWKAYQNIQTELISLCVNPDEIRDIMSDAVFASNIYLDILTTVEEGNLKIVMKAERIDEDDTRSQRIDLKLEEMSERSERSSIAGSSSWNPSEEIRYKEIVENITNILKMKRMSNGNAKIDLLEMIKRVEKCLTILELFDIGVKHWSPVLCVIMLENLDHETRHLWDNSSFKGGTPNHNILIEFLKLRLNMLEADNSRQRPSPNHLNHHQQSGNSVRHNQPPPQTRKEFNAPFKAKAAPAALSNSNRATPYPAAKPTVGFSCLSCPNVKEIANHNVPTCPNFLKLMAKERNYYVKRYKLCILCLRHGHMAKECESKQGCPKCERPHHGLICKKNFEPQSSCLLCGQTHAISECAEFLNLTAMARYTFLFEANLCHTCFKNGHSVTACPDRVTCKFCGAAHNVLLCTVDNSKSKQEPKVI